MPRPSPFKQPGILGKLAFSFTLLMAAALLTSFLISWYNTREAVIDRASEQLIFLRDSKKNQLNHYFQQRLEEVSFVSNCVNRLNVKNVWNKEILNSDIKSLFDTSGITFRYLASCKRYSHVSIISSSGLNRTFLCNENNNADAEDTVVVDPTLIQKALRSDDPVISDLIIKKNSSGESNYFIYFLSKIISNNAENCCMFEMPAGDFFTTVMDNESASGFESSVETYLVGKDLLMRSPSRFVLNSILKTKVSIAAIAPDNTDQPAARMIPDYRSKKVLSTSTTFQFGSNQWYLIAEIDYEEVLRPASNIINRYILFSAFILLFVIILTYFIARGITRPLARLTRATARIGYGHYDLSLDVEKNDETGTLAKAMTAMAVKIRDDKKEMQEREEHLQHFYNATIDGIILHDNGVPVLINTAMTTLTGYTTEELMKRNVTKLYVVKGTDLSSVLTRTYSFESFIRRKDGQLIPVEVQETSVEYSGKMIRASVIRNITKRIEVENALTEERQKRVSAVFDGQEIERRRLSRELHDGLGQSLIAVKLHLESMIVPEKPVSGKKMNEMRKMLDNLVDEVRQISNDLMPAVLVEFGFETAIKNMVRSLSENAGIKMTMQLDIPKELNDKIKTYVFRIIQEAFNNIVKHAQATEVNLYLVCDEEFLNLKVEDNGKGFIFEWQNAGKGNGLHNIRARVLLLGGTIHIRTAIGAGTLLDVKLPVIQEV
ncbi:MAG: PAS domain S-box protein [Bacteroidota bacterium]